MLWLVQGGEPRACMTPFPPRTDSLAGRGETRPEYDMSDSALRLGRVRLLRDETVSPKLVALLLAPRRELP